MSGRMDSPFDGRGARPAMPVRAPSPMVTWHRDAGGVLSSVSFAFGAELVEIDGAELDRVLSEARALASSDPYDDRLPPDWAVLEAALEVRS